MGKPTQLQPKRGFVGTSFPDVMYATNTSVWPGKVVIQPGRRKRVETTAGNSNRVRSPQIHFTPVIVPDCPNLIETHSLSSIAALAFTCVVLLVFVNEKLTGSGKTYLVLKHTCLIYLRERCVAKIYKELF